MGRSIHFRLDTRRDKKQLLQPSFAYRIRFDVRALGQNVGKGVTNWMDFRIQDANYQQRFEWTGDDIEQLVTYP
jgi:hypothetical protein